MIVTVHQAKTQLSRLIASAIEGEEIIIARGDKPAVRLVPVEEVRGTPRFGALKGQLSLDDRFFEPLTEAELALWAAESD
ncbi:MAG TPA: type II toxin-antitoxin system prevent-host-death family antitoxin [Caulobacteraceae bacterium]|jgi:prevent-host-death family protein